MRSTRQVTSHHVVVIAFLTLVASFLVLPSVASTTAPMLVKIVDSTGKSRLSNFNAVGSQFYFFVSNPSGKRNELWVSSGTALGTHMVKNIDPTGNLKLVSFAVTGSKFYFVVSDENAKGTTLGVTYKLWVSDGTALDTQMLHTFTLPKWHSWFDGVTVVGSKIYFFVIDENANKGDLRITYELWASDGTESGTQVLRNFTLPEWRNWFDGITVVGSKLYFFVSDPTEDQGGTTHGTQLWSSNGTAIGTQIIKNINPTNDYCCPDGAEGNDFYIVLGSTYLFTATDGTHGFELWSSDGTDAGTQVITIVNPNVNSSLTFGAQIVNKKLFFDVSDGTYANQLWVTNGTATGTKKVKTINSKGNAYLGNLKAIGSKLYFSANDGTHGNELWISDGTASSTRMVKDINPKGNSNIGNSVTWKSQMYFTANDGTHGNELWSSDGTSVGTRMVKDINPKGNSDIDMIGVRGSRLYFTATDGTQGIELWSSDGTSVGTRMMKDINPKGDSIISDVISASSTAIFSVAAESDFGSSKLWLTDGTTKGTKQVKIGTTAVSNSLGEVVLGSIFYFSFSDAALGNGLWKIADG